MSGVNMNNAEIVEAIIVVGPLLWKCVNCNLLFSREHSIDDHLISQHKSRLLPDASTQAKCKLSVCSCQHLCGDNVDRKVNRLKRNKRKIIELDSDNEKEDSSAKSSDNENLSTFSDGKFDLDSNGKNVDELVESCDRIPSEKMEDNSKSGAIVEGENDEQAQTGKRSFVMEERVHHMTKSIDEVDKNVEEFYEKDLKVLKSSVITQSSQEMDSVNKSGEESTKSSSMVMPQQNLLSTRKSGRSNKGKHSLYEEYEMKIS